MMIEPTMGILQISALVSVGLSALDADKNKMPLSIYFPIQSNYFPTWHSYVVSANIAIKEET